MSKFCFFFCLSLLFGLAACNTSANQDAGNSDPSATADYQQLGTAFCQCAEPSIELNNRMQQLTQEGKREEFIQLGNQVGEEFKKMLNCCKEKKQQLTTATLDGENIRSALQEACPDMPEQLSNQLVAKIK